MPERRVLGFKSALRLEGRGQGGQKDTKQRALMLGDSVSSSIRMKFLVHTGARSGSIFPELRHHSLG
jgi:hypothetical protein